jgi:uncharacterized DUF497 family protein
MHDDIVYKGKYIWYRGKNISNQRKHHISFETATNVFDDPFVFELFDETNSLDEDRYKVTGYIHGISYVTVSITYRDPLIRLLSARAAMPNEIEEYDENAERYLG